MVIKVIEENDRLLVTIPYSADRVAKIKQIPKRRWDVDNKYWIVPNNQKTKSLLYQIFSDEQVVEYKQNSCYAGEEKESQNYCSIIKEMESQLKLKGFSPKTRKAYLGHTLRFLNFFAKEPQDIECKDVRKYMLRLLDEQECSHSYVSQCLSALKFLSYQVLGRFDIVMDIP